MRQTRVASRTPPRPASALSAAPAWALAAASSLTSFAAHRLGGGAMPHGAQWLMPLVAALGIGAIIRPMRLTSRSVGVLLVLGQLLGHVALAIAVPHGMSAGALTPGRGSSGMGVMGGMGTAPDATATGVAVHDATVGMPGMGVSRVMLVAHLVGTLSAWLIAHLLLRVTGVGRARWHALTGRLALPRIVIRRRRVTARTERVSPARVRWATVAPLRGPPVGRPAAL